MRAAQKLNISTVAVYSDVDQNTLHVEMADEAICIGAPQPTESYLNVTKIIDAAKRVGADAIHPGYGFLSENYQFAAQCEAQQIEFVGPSSNAIRVMASKSEAANVAQSAGVPTIPGYRSSSNQDSAEMLAAAKKIGFPILLKSALGGGGRGMRVVDSESAFMQNLTSAKSESSNSFGSDEMIIEKFIRSARHIELQILADKYGNCVYMFDRECSTQRRYQKVIEEAPAPRVKSRVRDNMRECALRLAHELSYTNAGTVEFLMDGDDFFFIEMNTRLQVEHPVTELVTGVDLVKWQLLIASGKSLDNLSLPIDPIGHAVEARVYAEKTTNNFMPSPGTIDFLEFPGETKSLQIHSGVRSGDDVVSYYDSMIAKLVAKGHCRNDAVERLVTALENTYVVGIETNINFLHRLLQHQSFIKSEVDTTFIESNLDEFISSTEEIPRELFAAAGLYVHNKTPESSVKEKKSEVEGDQHSPWLIRSGWRLNTTQEYIYRLQLSSETAVVKLVKSNEEMNVQFDSHVMKCSLRRQNGINHVFEINQDAWNIPIVETDSRTVVFHRSSPHELRVVEYTPDADVTSISTGTLTAPLSGKVVRIDVKVGDSVDIGDCILVLEAMKMEHQINSTKEGIVSAIHCDIDDQINEDDICAEID